MSDYNQIPADFPVRPLGKDDKAEDRATCGTCGRSWDDAIPTSYTPAPSARCPFEAFHDEPDEEIYCNNDPCETEATHFYITSKGARFYLCFTCKEAFELGQVNAETDVIDVDDDIDEDEESEAA